MEVLPQLRRQVPSNLPHCCVVIPSESVWALSLRPSHIYLKPVFSFLLYNINCLKSPLYSHGTYFTRIWYVQLHYKWSQQPSVFQLYRCENRPWSHKSAAELTGAWTSRATSHSLWGWSLHILDNFMLKTRTPNKTMTSSLVYHILIMLLIDAG